MLRDAQIRAFNERGLIKIDGLFGTETIRAARQSLQPALEKAGLWRNEAWHLPAEDRPIFPMPGMNAKTLGRPSEIDALMEDPALKNALADLNISQTDTGFFGHPQILFTRPNSETWFVPAGAWHLDVPRLASNQRPGVQLFTFLDEVCPRGGGTLVAAGSHRLLNTGAFIRSRDVKRKLGQDRFFKRLFSDDGDRKNLLSETGNVDGFEIEITELTGAPGDAYLMDLRTLHTLAPNTAQHPRIMVTQRFVTASCVPELSPHFNV